MFDRHTVEYMLHILSKLPDALYTDWNHKVIGTTKDGASNMFEIKHSVSSKIEEVALPRFYQVWRVLH